MWKQFSAAETQAKAINQHLNPPSLKRLRSEDTEYQHTCKPIDDQESSLLSDNKIGHYTGVISPSRWFIWIESCNGVFESEVYSQRNETLYIPVRDDVLINLKNIEQISFGSGTYFIGDMQARFTDTAQGKFHVVQNTG
ncbi:hypothetical protein TrispH2_001386 [Trichoplax sp. H2]|uniref:Uncharacterized protein n=1 Tax=Trichoplax adhaerens TaxID=10228 RepID=B3S1P9_TRIAD|nr:hypothetical protein TRIADDRAFT_57840 [Trichoplax adhaerens]EDV23331.1 hypothetical protein TRIADDRAFT_57840 [Trichoplax adhaerens]RDD46196.1 hypothetical protein TrispH2_001386 [Trichoplax sp. H2]|eukprot:XP_002114241.1 hypothetical protein TRIADDRAFT_57840 [Trichoplax adhaerens]